jgi:hypothetical protein
MEKDGYGIDIDAGIFKGGKEARADGLEKVPNIS